MSVLRSPVQRVLAPRYATIRWLCEIQRHYRFLPDALHLGVALFDHYVDTHKPPPHGYRLYGFTALWVALKYEERSVPILSDILSTVKKPFDADTVRTCEQRLFATCMHRLDLPTDMLSYGNLIRKQLIHTRRHRQTVLMLLELALFYRERTQFKRWHRVCASLYLARLLYPQNSTDAWSVACKLATRCSLKAMTPAIRFLFKALEQASSVIRCKYPHVYPQKLPKLPV